MKDPYSALGIGADASDDEVKEAYRALARKYHPDNYGDDNPLKDLANEKMQQVNEAYDTILRDRQNRKKYQGKGTYYSTYSGTGETTPLYTQIRQALNARRFGEAERLLSSVDEGNRVAEWHYLTSIVLMRRGRVNDAMRELEIACSMEPGNLEYQKAKEMFNNRAQGYGSTYYGTSARPMRSSSDDICETCIKIKMCDCLCECLGGDLIPCI